MNNFYLPLKLIGSYLVILLISLIIYKEIIPPLAVSEINNLKIGLLSWSATIYAPVAAYLLFDGWKHQIKEQRKEKFILNYLSEIEYVREMLSSMIINYDDLKEINSITPIIESHRQKIHSKHLEASKILKTFLSDKHLHELIDNEFKERSELIKTYWQDLIHVFKNFNEDTKQNFIKKYTTGEFESGIIIYYANNISKPVCDHCYKLLKNF
ncbi:MULTISPECIES: hypothetical protein [Acinetobacter calcoaceticus/baumannii complex]|uniref:hypothetical protein n=1 Tax=Acinetobacter calcoaceticus/baumannii complex TaxID=909768 RepID=UPI000F6682EA|nr:MULTISPECIES: hypothetical protein [Acinetobacter calcoaceticus/baumannii complex]QCA00752.1 hypothetical protein KAN01_09020 [Acinetobacter nosocomialis]RSF30749.1 hypothetical protein EGU05_16755 [Acinetobacter baumannii]